MNFDFSSDQRFADLINKYIQSETKEDLAEQIGKGVVDFIIDTSLEIRGIINADKHTRKRIHQELLKENEELPRVGGAQTVAQTAIGQILKGEYVSGVNLIVNNMEERELNIKQYISEVHRKNAQKSRPDALNDLLLEMLEENANITEPEVIELLEGGYSDNVYIQDINEGITIEIKVKEKTIIEYVKISALKDRLTRCRAKIFSK
jgi:hypothetical protein